MKVKLQFLWYDFWIGFYYDRYRETLYFCPLPCVVFSFKRVYNPKNITREERMRKLAKRVQRKLKLKIEKDKGRTIRTH